MTDFAIDPPLHITGRSGTFVRSTEQAAAFVREHMLRGSGHDTTAILRRLENVRSSEQAKDAAQAFRVWLMTAMHTGLAPFLRRLGEQAGYVLHARWYREEKEGNERSLCAMPMRAALMCCLSKSLAVGS